MDKFSFRIDSDNRACVRVNGKVLDDITEINIHGLPWDCTITAERVKRNSKGVMYVDGDRIATELVTYHFSKEGDNESIKEIKREV